MTEKESAILQKSHKNYIICKRVVLKKALKESEVIKATVVATEWLKLNCRRETFIGVTSASLCPKYYEDSGK